MEVTFLGGYLCIVDGCLSQFVAKLATVMRSENGPQKIFSVWKAYPKSHHLFDVTLACDDCQVQTHGVLLALYGLVSCYLQTVQVCLEQVEGCTLCV